MIIIPVFIVIFVFGIFTIYNEIKKLEHEKYNNIAASIENELSILINEKHETLLNIALSASQNSLIKTSLIEKNISALELQTLSQKLATHGSLKNIWFHLIDANGKSLYRSWSQKKGDNLVPVRPDVAQMMQIQKISSVISVGKFDLSFKTMIPIFDDEKFVGIFETIAKFNSIAIKMSNKNYETIVIVDKKFTPQIKKPFSKLFANDYYIANVNALQKNIDFIKKHNVESFINSKERYQIFNNENYFVSTYHLYDLHNYPMAYIIVLKQLNHINTDDIKQVKTYFISVFIIILLVTGIVLYFIYNGRYKQFMESMHVELEQKVHEKTEKLNHLAHHDILTNLPNRSLFLDRLDHAIKHAKRVKTQVAVLFLDLDRFKEVNDTLGHEAGDELLIEVTNRVVGCLREEDTISRFGGDEFTILIEEVDAQDITHIADKIILAMQKPFIIMNNNLFVTFSIGISMYPSDGKYSDMLIRNADTAMYKAKEMGKNRFTFYDKKMTHDMLERIDLEKNIRSAIENNEFIPYFQPQINAITNKVVGVEALIRWESPEFGFMSPAKFIPIAEDTGLIIDVGRWMIVNTIKVFNKLYLSDIFKGRISINLSAKQLEYPNFLNELHQILKETQCDPNLLEFEITESQIMADPKKTIDTLQEIKSLGIKLSIDDFGTGYSSLSYLSKLPIDKLKIDKSFIDDIMQNEENIAIVKSIIALAKSLNLEIIAEGVESNEQKDFLVSVGCYIIQGYLYSKPLSQEDFEQFNTHV